MSHPSTRTIVVTGAGGFVGKHLVQALSRLPDATIIEITRNSSKPALDEALRRADVVYHLAGTNRPEVVEQFETGNAEFTAQLCASLAEAKNAPLVVFSSSVQATLENPYGSSKLKAEKALQTWALEKQGDAIIFRLPNVFGKWCRPNYNSVVATFCHNIAHDLPIQVSDPRRSLELVHIDDVIEALLNVLTEAKRAAVVEGRVRYMDVSRKFQITLGELADHIRSFRTSRVSLISPTFSNELTRLLYGVYLTYLERGDFSYELVKRSDPRGVLAEFIKQPEFGQIFVSRTAPGITRGNHFHNSKSEKFLVLEGDAIIRFRPVLGKEIIEYKVNGSDFKVVDIPPGYVHSIENVGSRELITLFWANEIFDPAKPDVYSAQVLN